MSLDERVRAQIQTQLRPPQAGQPHHMLKLKGKELTAAGKRSRTDEPHTEMDAETILHALQHTLQTRPVAVSSSTFTGLEVRHCGITPSEVDGRSGRASLASILCTPGPCADSFAKLLVLDLECNLLGNEGVKRLCAALLPQLPSLRNLHLASNGIHVEGLAALVQFLSKGTLPLEVIGLTNNPVASSADGQTAKCGELLAQLVFSLAHCLVRLFLNHAGLGHTDAVELLGAAVLHGTPRLDAIYLKQNAEMRADQVPGAILDRCSEKTVCAAVLRRVVL